MAVETVVVGAVLVVGSVVVVVATPLQPTAGPANDRCSVPPSQSSGCSAQESSSPTNRLHVRDRLDRAEPEEDRGLVATGKCIVVLGSATFGSPRGVVGERSRPIGRDRVDADDRPIGSKELDVGKSANVDSDGSPALAVS